MNKFTRISALGYHCMKSVNPNKAPIFSHLLKSFSTTGGSNAEISSSNAQKVVFISQSSDVYSNLAFEDWLYRNWNFEKRNVLFLWRNEPCVVIGRHQNPYVEADLDYLANAGVPVVRRNSGGGAVYHDEGNLNCTFFTARKRYNRKNNLALICKALKHDFGLDAEVNHKDDIMVNNYKVSGTAAKLACQNAYHHCTLLLSTNKLQMKLALQGDKKILTNATPSLPCEVMNLSEVTANLSVDKVMESIGRKYLESAAEEGLANGFTLISPSDDWFPGLQAISDELSSWHWLHGKTPKFTVTKPVSLPSYVSPSTDVDVAIVVHHGKVESVGVKTSDVPKEVHELFSHVSCGMKGSRYSGHTIREVHDRLRLPHSLQSQRVFG